MRATKYTDIPDSELTATELVLKHEFLEKYALDVEHAEARLRKFQRDHGETQLTESLHLVKSASSDGGDAKKPFIDTTLFGGLEYAMTESPLFIQQISMTFSRPNPYGCSRHRSQLEELQALSSQRAYFSQTTRNGYAGTGL